MSRAASPLSFSIAAMIALAGAAACVTVNVNFPEATVQKATDDYVKELYRAKEKGRAAPSASGPASVKPSAKPETTSSIDSLLISSAYAAEISTSFRMDSEDIQAIQKRQADRLERIIAAKKGGNLGETNEGLLTLEHPGKVKEMLKKSLQPLVEAENKDRQELFAKVLELNSMSKNRMKDIQRNFSRSFQKADPISPSGTWIQDAQGKWTQKP